MENKYKILLDLDSLKADFLFELIALFSGNDLIQVKQDWLLINTSRFRDYINKARYPDKHRLEAEDFENLKNQFKQYEPNEWNVLGITETEFALIDKLHHIIFWRGGFKPALEMLKSFKRGTKRLRSNYGSDDYPRDERNYTGQEDNEKWSHTKNYERAHFRWNRGGRYTLNDDQINKIEQLIQGL